MMQQQQMQGGQSAPTQQAAPLQELGQAIGAPVM